MSTGASTDVRAGTREWLGLTVLLLPTVLLFLAITVLFLATPYIAADLGATSTEMLWINDIYGFVMAGLLVTMGTLGDRIGRRRLLLVGSLIFGAASLFAAFAPTIESMIGARALMGLGAAALMPSTLSLISTMFQNDKQRATAIGMWAAAVSAGVALGPLVGGLLLEAFGWGAAFLVGVPVTVLVLIAAPLLIPEYRTANAARIDLLSVVLSMTALLPIVYGVKEFAKSGLGPVSVLAILVGLAFGVVFVRRQGRLDSPLLDMRLFANRTFSGAVTVFLLGAVGIGGIYLLFTQYLQQVAGLSPLAAGLAILPAAVLLIIVSTVTPAIARHVQPAYLIAGGLLLSAIGYLVLTQVDSVAGLPVLLIGFYILYPGIAPVMALVPGMLIGAAPPEKAGEASAVNSTAADLGTALGIAVVGSVGTAVYRGSMTEGGTADESLTDALAVAGTLPGAAGEALIDTARAAFTSGLNVAAIVAAVLALAGAALSVTVLRKPAEAAEPAEVAAPAPDRELETV
ncbi:MFS transporter [Nocardia uniformis]|uniref:MFS transporter n=1 Tax=Nocardia uniformis TaxID=53432 RepID=A0A849CD93_9NOCA|nr:MFS transporter [Nocardia uniformis]NNH75926.1 MFS transporter [Nocardia uniformis]